MKTPPRDFRSLDETAQAEVRRQAFRNLDDGMRRKKVALLAEVHYKTIGDWIIRRKEFEKREYRGKKRGRILNEQKLLTTAEEKRIKAIIETKTPDKAGLSYALWNRKAIKELVKKKTKKTMVIETVSKYAKRWGFTPQRPAKYAIEQNTEAVQKWLTLEYPKISERARKEGAEIHWEDEAGVALSTFYARSYAPQGKTPAIRLPVRHASLSMISSIANRGDLRFMIYRGALNADLFIVFLRRLTKDSDKKIFLIADNLRVHKAKKVTAWVKEHDDKIALFFPSSLRSAIQSR